MKKLTIALAALLIGMICQWAGAGDNYWQHNPATPGDWFDPANWTLPDVPDSGDSAYINNGGEAEITSGAAEAAAVWLGYYNGESGTITHSGGTLAITVWLAMGEYGGATGTYNLSGTGALTADELDIGYRGTGTFNHINGTNTVASNVYVGYNSGSSGTYTISNGTLDVADGLVSVGPYGTGLFELNGGLVIADEFELGAGGTFTSMIDSGTLRINTLTGFGPNPSFGGDLDLGHSGGSATSSYTLGAGQSLTVGEILVVGWDATGTFTQTGGTNTVDYYLVLAENPGSEGTYNLSGTGNVSAHGSFIGYEGTGTFTHTGGINTLTDWLSIGATGQGTYQLSGNAQLFSGNQFVGHWGGTGTFAQSGGTNTVSTRLSIGEEGGSSGTYTITDGTLDVAGGLISVGPSGTGLFELNGGTVIADEFALGAGGTFTSGGTGGTLRVNTLTGFGTSPSFTGDLELGQSGGSGSGSYTIASGQSLTVGGYLVVGYDIAASFTQTGGTNTVVEGLYVGKETGSSGTYNLSGTGELSADKEYIGWDGTGTFTQTGGTNTVSDIISVGIEYEGSYGLSGTGQVTANRVGLGLGAPGTFTQTGGVVTITGIDGWLMLGFDPGGSGFYELSDTGELSADEEWIGVGSTGTFTQTGGTNTVVGDLYVGKETGSSGTYNLSGTGQLTTSHEIIGNEGTGTFIQTSGTNTVNCWFRIGNSSGSHGTYTMTDGILDICEFWVGHDAGSTGLFELSAGTVGGALTEYIGYYGEGTFTQTGGTHTVTGDLNVGWNSGSNGTYNLSGTGELNVGQEWIGVYGTGTFTQTGGTNTINTELVLGYESGSSGTYTITGGTLDVAGGLISVGPSGTGLFELNGGTVIADEFELGTGGTFTSSGTTGTLRVNTLTGFGNSPSFAGSLELGHAGGSGTSNYALGTGQSLAIGNDLAVGYDGTATFTQTGGTNMVNSYLVLGDESGSEGTYELSGTGQLSADREYLGYYGAGNFTQTGGTNTVGLYLVLGYESGSDGTYVLSGTGQLSAVYENIGYRGTGTFTQSGGTNTPDRLRLGDLSGSDGTYTISGGSLVVPDLYIGNSGSGTFNMTDAAAYVEVSNLLYFGPDSTFTAVPGAEIHMTGSAFENENTNPTDLAGLSNLELIFEGGSGVVDTFEVSGQDMGDTIDGWINNYALGALTLGGTDIGQIQFVDLVDNQPGWAGDEIFYVYDLNIGAGSSLDLNGCDLYYLTGSIDPAATVVYNGGSLTQVFVLGDVNGDGFVGGGDLNTILSNWGLSGATRQQGDLTGEGDVGGADYNEVLSHWGEGIPPAAPPEAIPEPATLGLLVMGSLALLRRRR